MKFLFEPTVNKNLHHDHQWYGPVMGVATTGKRFYSTGVDDPLIALRFITVAQTLDFLRRQCS